MGSPVPPQDVALLHRLRDEGIMEEVRTGDMHLEVGMIAIFCGDGDQFDDEYMHMRGLFQYASARVRIHPLSLNGGALLISPNWPTASEGEVFVKHTLQAEGLKGIKTVSLFTHVPCGAAGLVHWSVAQVIDELINAKRRLKEQDPSLTVICLLHVDWSKCNGETDPRKRTYHVTKDKWLAARREYL